MLESKSNRIALYVSAFLVVALVLFAILRDNSTQVSLVDAQKILANDEIENIVATKKFIYIKTSEDVYKIASSQVSPSMFQNHKVEVGGSANIIVYILFFILFAGIATLLYSWWQRNSKGTFSPSDFLASGSNSQKDSIEVIKPTKSDVSFSDIGGISDVKVELEEIIDFMKNTKRYKNFGARMPRGVLLVGPPGVGKTMIAKAVAHEARVPFYYQSGASFVQIYVGMGAKRVHELFEAAKNNSPSIIFIDEIDAVGKKRDGQRNDEREATLNQLLTEMDGFEGSSGVIVIAATNKIDVLDSALLRAGRFDRRIFVELPTKRERQSILAKYLVKVPNEVDVKTVANMTVGFNGASLAALVNEAALLALRNHDYHVTIDHFHHVKDKVIFGKKKLQVLSDEQKEYRVRYQAGKVLCAAYYNLTFEKIMLSNEKLTPSTDEPLIKYELESRVKMLLAGMAASDLKFNQHASSAKNDLDEAKDLVRKMISEYGMGQSLMKTPQEEELLMNKLYNECKDLISTLSSVMDKIENVLAERESITKDEVLKYINEIS